MLKDEEGKLIQNEKAMAADNDSLLMLICAYGLENRKPESSTEGS
jgi:hypothetical protein